MLPRALVSLGCVLCCLFVSTVPAVAQDAATRKAITAMYGKVCEAYSKKDLSALKATAVPDLVFYEVGGKSVTLKEMEGMLQQMFSQTKSLKVTEKADKWAMQGKDVLVDSTMTTVSKMDGPDKKPHEVAYASKSRDLWRKTAQGWRIVRIQAVSETMKVDGKPAANPMASPPK